MKKLVFENLNEFYRGRGERGLKASIFGFRLGQIVVLEDDDFTIVDRKQSVYVIGRIWKDGEIVLICLGIITWFELNPPSFEFYRDTYHTSSENVRVLNKEEAELVENWLNQPDNEEDIKTKEVELNWRNPGKNIKIFIG